MVEQHQRFEFYTCNNQTEYEALITSLKFAKEMVDEMVQVKSDSKLVTNQTSGTWNLSD